MKKIILSFVMVAASVAGFAQNKHVYDENRFLDNWSVGTDGGISTNLHDWDTPNGGVWGIQLTKGITPVVSFEFSGQLGFNDNANWNMPHSSNAVDNVTVMGSTKINLMNLFCGYKGTPRLFEIQARGGIGYMRSFYPDNGARHGSTDVNRAVSKLGLDFDFNLGKEKAWTVSLRPAVVLKAQNGDAWCDNYDCSRYSHNAVGQLTAGVVYHFKGTSGTRHFTQFEPQVVTNTVRYTVEKVIEKPVEKVVEKVVEKHDTVYVNVDNSTSKYLIAFQTGKSELNDQAKNLLDKIQCTEASIDAYASPDGDAAKNQALSEARANAVKTYLESKGIKVNNASGRGVSTIGKVAVISGK